MKYLLLSLLTLFLAIAIGSVVVKDAGYMLISISGWKIETSAVLFFITLFLIFIVVYFSVRSLVRAWQLPNDIRAWQANKKQYRRLCKRDSRLTEFSSLGNLSLIQDNS